MTSSTSGPVGVVDYDAAWVQSFADYAARIRRALSPAAVRMEHIGSTAVPGLAAKPMIDVQVSVPQLAAFSQYKPGLESLGFLHPPHPKKDEAREFFRPAGPGIVRVHAVQGGSAAEWRYLIHRNFLGAHPTVASEYGDLKKRLAGELRDARQDYQCGKNPYLEHMQREAEEWAITANWSPDSALGEDER
jgi:GrpB-like predicted nucleotidyltransferase (UPF0157 family)